MALPITSLCETYQKGTDFSMNGNQIGNAAVTPKHPCAIHSRWRNYAFTSDDFNTPIEVVDFENKLLIMVGGVPRTIVDSFQSNDGSRSPPGSTWGGPGLYYVRF